MFAFRETQRFTQWWLWLLLIIIGIGPIIGNYKQLIQKEFFDSSTMSNSGLILYALFMFAIIALFLLLCLKTEINLKGIQMNYIPFLKKHTDWKDIEAIEVVNYGFVGGWGIRWGTSYGTVYNTKGNKGLAVKLNNGKTFVIGTQKEEELKKAIEKAKALGLV